MNILGILLLIGFIVFGVVQIRGIVLDLKERKQKKAEKIEKHEEDSENGN